MVLHTSHGSRLVTMALFLGCVLAHSSAVGAQARRPAAIDPFSPQGSVTEAPPGLAPSVCNSGTNPATVDACPSDGSAPSPTASAWNHFASQICAATGAAFHAGIDVIVPRDGEQWVAAKLMYGASLCELQDERVELWIRTSCGIWELFGETATTPDGGVGSFHGISDDGGWAFFTLPAIDRLPPGSYPGRLIVKGDLTYAKFWMHVWHPGTRVVVTDLDGTLSTAEVVGPWSSLNPSAPLPRAGATALLDEYQTKGYRIIYLSARPLFHSAGTRTWLQTRGFQLDALHLSQVNFAETGTVAVDYKKNFLLAQMADAGAVVDWAYGNLESDLLAYLGAGITPSHIYLVEGDYAGDPMGAVLFSDFGAEHDRVACLPPVNSLIFIDGFESGDRTAWATSQP